MKGDIRSHPSSSSVFLYSSTNPKTSIEFPPSLEQEEQELQHETIKPYTRKWETSIMNTIDELHLISKYKPLKDSHHKCDVIHDVPAILFSTGGYTGNVYHEFNDGIIPLYITSRPFNRKVIFVIIEYHEWWYTKYAQILSQLSDYPPIDFYANPKRTRCFKEAIVGLKIHNELTVDPPSIQGSQASILDFRNLLAQAFEPQVSYLSPSPKSEENHKIKKPKLVLLSRKGSRSITNEHSLVKLAQQIGFHVQILKPSRETELASIYKVLSTSDVMVGVHGAAMTHFLFLKPGSILIQVIPLGTDWASDTYYGEPAKKMRLKYVRYKIDPKESSLYYKYDENADVLRDPTSVNNKGWEFTKRIYLDDQKVSLDLKRFKLVLARAYNDCSINSRNAARAS